MRDKLVLYRSDEFFNKNFGNSFLFDAINNLIMKEAYVLANNKQDLSMLKAICIPDQREILVEQLLTQICEKSNKEFTNSNDLNEWLEDLYELKFDISGQSFTIDLKYNYALNKGNSKNNGFEGVTYDNQLFKDFG